MNIELLDYEEYVWRVSSNGIDVKVQKIIRCKDCKYWDYEVDNDVGFCVRTEDCDWNADDFCSKGVRRG